MAKYHEESYTRGSAGRGEHRRGMATVIEPARPDHCGRVLGLERTLRRNGEYPEEDQDRGRRRGGFRDRAERRRRRLGEIPR